jgi:hypothetical protein
MTSGAAVSAGGVECSERLSVPMGVCWSPAELDECELGQCDSIAVGAFGEITSLSAFSGSVSTLPTSTSPFSLFCSTSTSSSVSSTSAKTLRFVVILARLPMPNPMPMPRPKAPGRSRPKPSPSSLSLSEFLKPIIHRSAVEGGGAAAGAGLGNAAAGASGDKTCVCIGDNASSFHLDPEKN